MRVYLSHFQQWWDIWLPSPIYVFWCSLMNWGTGKERQNAEFLKKLIYLAASGLSCPSWDLFSCSMWDLVPWPEIPPRPPALGACNLSHWTREMLACRLFKVLISPWRARQMSTKAEPKTRIWAQIVCLGEVWTSGGVGRWFKGWKVASKGKLWIQLPLWSTGA